MDGRCNDRSFGPGVPPNCRGGFDFTLLFEHSMLSLLPSAILITAAPVRIYHLLHQNTKAHPNKVLYLKLGVSVCFAVLQLAYLIRWTSDSGLRNNVSLAQASLRLIDTVALGALSAAEHTRSIQPSTILTVYLLSTVVFDAVQVRTLWLLGGRLSLCVVASLSLFLKALFLALEAQNKRKSLLKQYRSLPPEATSGILNRCLFWWLNPFLWHGFRHLISVADISRADPQLSSTALNRRFHSYWQNSPRTGKRRLLFATIWSLRRAILAAVVPRLCQTGFTFTQPFLISRVIDFVAQTTDQDKNAGYGLIAATAIIYGGLAVSVALYKHKTFRMMTMTRGGLISLIYSKTLRVNAASLKDAAAMTLMSTDIDSIVTGWTNIHEMWASPIEVGLALYLLELRVGLACIAPVVIAVLSTIGSAQIAKFLRRRQERWLQAVQKRVGMTSSLLTDIKGLKMLNVLARIADQIQALRLVEVEQAKSYLRIDALMNVCANASTLLSPVATLLIFSLVLNGSTGGNLTSATAYYTLTVVALMSSPLGLALNTLPTFIASLACFSRIQDYLTLEERREYRLFSCLSPGPDNLTSRPSSGSSQGPVDGTDIELSQIQSTARAQGLEGSEDAATIGNGCFGYDNEENAVLRDISLQIRAKSFNVVLGPVGSGKSTLLKAFLGEVNCHKGFVRLTHASTAYCGQEAWLQNQSLRENILCGSDYEEKFYLEVIAAVGLDYDIAKLPQRDRTVLGARANKLSGGQAQRVAIARTVYARRPLLILDDCFSGLDSKTEKLVSGRLFGSSGLLKSLGCTVIFATHSTQHVSRADSIVTLNAKHATQRQGPAAMLSRRVSTADQIQVVGASNNGAGQSRSMETDIDEQAGASLEVETNDTSRQIGDSRIYRFYLKQLGWPNLFVYLFLNGSYVFCTRFAQIWVGQWVNVSTQSPGRQTDVVYGASYGGFQIAAAGFFGSLLLFMFQVMVPRSAQRLHWTLLQTTIHAGHHFHSSTDPGITLNRFSQDMTLVDLDLPSNAIEFVIDAFSCTGQAIVIALGVKYVAALLPVIALLVYLLQRFYLRTSRQVRLLDLEAKSALVSHMLETYDGIESIRAFGWDRRFRDHNLALLDISQRPFYALFCIQRWLGLVLALMVAGVAVCLVTFGTQLRSSTNENAIGVALINVITFSQILLLLITSYTSLETALGAILRIKNFTTQVKPEDDPAQQLLESVPEWSTPRTIELKNLTVSYDISARPAIDNLSLLISTGMTIGICGRSGSGKSSLLMALLRLAPVVDGRILVNDLDVSKVASNVVRSLYNTIPQAPVLFPGSVRANLDPFSTHSDPDLVAALQRLALWDVLLPRGGLDTDMDATPLSQGQKQLFGFGRSLVINGQRRILLLDESTSSMDAQTEYMAMRFVKEQFPDHIILAVAHRLEIISTFDRVAVMDAGRLIEYDTPDNLLRKDGGAFKSLWTDRAERQT